MTTATFFPDKRGQLYPVADIVEIAPRHDGFYGVSLRSERTVVVSEHTFDHFLVNHCTPTAIAAQPGTRLLSYDSHDNAVDSVPIIAWMLSDDAPVPITVSGPYDGFGNIRDLYETAIQHPDGSITVVDDVTYETIDQWRDTLIARAAADAAREAEQAKQKAEKG